VSAEADYVKKPGSKQVTIAKFLPKHRIEEAEAAGLWPNRLITDYLDDAVARHPDKTAVIAYNSGTATTIRKSFAELKRASIRAALGLTAMGVRSGDVISVQLPNRWEFIVLYVACTRVRAICNPLLPIYRSRELRFMLAQAESVAMFIPAAFRGVDYSEMIAGLRPELPKLREVVVVDETPAGPVEKLFADGPLNDPGVTDTCASLPRPHPNDIAEILYTSGTTGQPKGVMHTHNTLYGPIEQYIRALDLTRDDVVLQSSPIAHQAGLLHGVLMPIMLGSTVVLQDVWDAEKAVCLIEEHAATHIHAATPFLADLADCAALDHHDISSLRTFVCAGAPIPRALVRRAVERLHIDVIACWGMSEIGTATCTRREDPPERIFGTDGGPLRGVELRIVDDASQPLPPGMQGRLQARGMSLFVGYLKRPDLDAADEDGWFDTGDLARMDIDGYIRITGRTKDLIIRGGQNIPIVEIEEQLLRHPAVKESAIVGIPDPRLGERACAFVVLRPSHHLTFADMICFLKEAGTATPYLPERLEIIDEIPRTASGKMQKFRLREIAAGLTLSSAGRTT
jgi:cyclohexanecarboxylate-CoA ligase